MAGSTKAAPQKKESGVEVDVKSTHQKYLESVLSEENEAPVFRQFSNPGDGEVITEDGYIGTDPIYQNAANETEVPHQSDEGGDKLAEDFYLEAFKGDGKEASDALKQNYADVTRSEKSSGSDSSEPVAPSKEDEETRTPDEPAPASQPKS